MSEQPSSYVILIDIDDLIIKPCFPLFPEWGECLFVASKGDKQNPWQTVDYLLSMRESTDIHLTIWLLSEKGVDLADAITEMENQKLRPMLSTLRHIQLMETTYKDVEILSISYHYQADIEPFDEINGGDIQLVTQFEYPLLQNDELLSQQWLMPMGLRALFHQSQLLNRHISAFQRIKIIGDEEQLLALISNHRKMLLTFLSRLSDNQKKLREEIGKLPLNSLNSNIIIDAPLLLDDLTDVPHFHFTYTAGDEQTLRDWIRQIDRYPEKFKHYNQYCHDTYLATIRTLNNDKWLSAQPASTWIKTGVTGELSHRVLLQNLKKQAERLQSERKNIHFQLPPSDNKTQLLAIEQEKNKKRYKLEKRLINSCRKRPNTMSLWVLALLPLLMMTAMLFIGQPIKKAIPYHDILIFSGGISTLWLILVALKVYWTNRQFRHDCAWAESQLSLFHKQIRLEAASINKLAHNLLNDAVVHQNIETVMLAKANYQRDKDKIDYHMTQIDTHLSKYGGGNYHIDQLTKQSTSKNALPEVDINEPVERQPAYFWLDSKAQPQIYEGRSLIERDNFPKEYVRYPSIKKIIFFGK